jgi:hypothetical protein
MNNCWLKHLGLFTLLIGCSTLLVAAEECTLEHSQCGGAEALGCSTQQAMAPLTALSPELGQLLVKYSGRFEPACIQHDFCYRHGLRTYGTRQVTCDNDFESAMYGVCQTTSGSDLLNFAVELGECLAAARLFAETVRAAGAQHFQQSESSCCFYAGKATANKNNLIEQ